jgi:hypothetical protein
LLDDRKIHRIKISHFDKFLKETYLGKYIPKYIPQDNKLVCLVTADILLASTVSVARAPKAHIMRCFTDP